MHVCLRRKGGGRALVSGVRAMALYKTARREYVLISNYQMHTYKLLMISISRKE
jgi:hypothetical protein